MLMPVGGAESGAELRSSAARGDPPLQALNQI